MELPIGNAFPPSIPITRLDVANGRSLHRSRHDRSNEALNYPADRRPRRRNKRYRLLNVSSIHLTRISIPRSWFSQSCGFYKGILKMVSDCWAVMSRRLVSGSKSTTAPSPAITPPNSTSRLELHRQRNDARKRWCHDARGVPSPERAGVVDVRDRQSAAGGRDHQNDLAVIL